MTHSNKLGLVLLLAATLAGCAGKKTTKAEAEKPVPVAGKPAAKPAPAKPGSKPTETAKPAEPAKPVEPPKTPDEQFKEALASLKAKNFAEARAGFEKLAKEHPELSGPLSNLGVLDAKEGKREAAIADFSRAVVANPNNAMAYNWLGLLYREAKAYPESEKAYLKAIDARKDYAQPQLNLGILYEVYLNRPGEALARYRTYQQLTSSKELKVTAWIKNLEEAGVVLPSAPAAPAPAAVPAEKPKAKKA